MTLARGARQFVVHETLETMSMSEVHLSSLTSNTTIGASAKGREYHLRAALEVRCGLFFGDEDTLFKGYAFEHMAADVLIERVLGLTVDSTTYSAPSRPQGGSRVASRRRRRRKWACRQ